MELEKIGDGPGFGGMTLLTPRKNEAAAFDEVDSRNVDKKSLVAGVRRGARPVRLSRDAISKWQSVYGGSRSPLPALLPPATPPPPRPPTIRALLEIF